MVCIFLSTSMNLERMMLMLMVIWFVGLLDHKQRRNLYLPHLEGNQLGDTYYFLPVRIYYLGNLNTSEENIIYANIYKEFDAKKGGNDITLILLYHLVNYVVNNVPYAPNIEELNLMMDNCGEQNKNGTVLKKGAYIVEHG